ncbi:MAG: hypothetical protein K2H98_05885, partial [Duncaniella sp.]|nr:hypothetical protein [Duncaniella sp.]
DKHYEQFAFCLAKLTILGDFLCHDIKKSPSLPTFTPFLPIIRRLRPFLVITGVRWACFYVSL